MASKRRLRRKACEAKIRHATLEGALIARKRTPGRYEMIAYKCPHCSGFHIGHPPARVRQSIAARRRERGQE